MTTDETVRTFDDPPVGTRLKLSALWTSVMLCYIYGDIGSLYTPGWLQAVLDGKMPGLGATTQGALLGGAVFMTVPALMVVLSLTLRPRAARAANITLGALYTVAMLATAALSRWVFYIFMGVVEAVLTLAIIWLAWRWPSVHMRRSVRD
jgi:hypothetical protein